VLLGVATVALLVFLPRQAERAARTLLPDESEWRDTVPLAEALAARQEAFATEQARLAAARDSALRQAALAAAPAPALPPEQRARRDSLERVAGELSRSLERVQVAPLLASYRGLGETEALRAEPAVRAVLDSLLDVERQRETYGTEGGTDPVYVALTARANELGRRLQSTARERLAGDREALSVIRQPRAARHPLLELPPVDTLAALSRLTSARDDLRVATDSLEIARLANREYASRLATARRRELAAAPPLAVLLAGLVVGLALAYFVSFLREVVRPRVGGLREVERITGSRVLAIAGPRHEVPEWNRRRSDLENQMHLVQPGSRVYRTLYLHLSATGATVPIVTVSGPDPLVNGVVGANLAAAAASDGRGTLLVDLDTTHSVSSRVLRLALDPGVTDVRAGTIAWTEGVSSIPIGRDRLMDVITSGTQGREGDAGSAPAPDEPSAPVLRRSLTRMARRYDLAVLVAPVEEARRGDAGLIAMPDVLICAQVGATTHRALHDAVQAARGGGLRLRGIVLWDGPTPKPPAAIPGRRYRRWETPESTVAGRS